MAEYKISGIWKNDEGVITHYAMHTKTLKGHTRAKKVSKKEAIELLEKPENTAITWIWNYKTCYWTSGENVEVVNSTNKYLRSNRDNKETNNLEHLINYDWISN